MCAPLAAVAGIAMVAGTAMQIAAQKQAQGARKSTLSEFLNKQNKHTDDSIGEIDRRSAQVKNSGGEIQGLQDQRVGAYLSATDKALPTSMVTTGNKVIGNEMAKGQSAAKAYSKAQARSRGRLDAFGDYMNRQAIANAETGGNIGLIGSFLRGNNAILPGQLEEANHAGDTLAGIGNLFSTAGSLGLTAASSGKTIGGPKKPTAPPNAPYGGAPGPVGTSPYF